MKKTGNSKILKLIEDLILAVLSLPNVG